jgi:ABC-type nickel/cobalt efflux system permease component RcnA
MRNHKRAPRILLLAWMIFSLLANPPAGDAHPMGNFSISHYAAIFVDSGYLELNYIVDVAEIPTYQEMQDSHILAKRDDPLLAGYLARKAASLADGLRVEVNGLPVQLEVVSQDAIFPAGAGGLPTMKLGFIYRAALAGVSPASNYTVHYRDNNFADRAGWKEIIVNPGAGVTLTSSSAPRADRSAQLSNYPTDLINSPPQNLEATFSFILPHASNISAASSKRTRTPTFETPSAPQSHQSKAAKPVYASTPSPAVPQNAALNACVPAAATSPTSVALHANQQATPRSKFTELVSSPHLSFWFLFTAALIAVGLGALHALEPGHGKTIVAAYLVGSRGTPKHAVLLGLIVTAAHTSGVYLLGAVTLYASKYIVPEHLYPWLGVISGLTIAVLACFLLLRGWTGEDGGHTHEDATFHSHWFSSLGKQRAQNSTVAEHFRGDKTTLPPQPNTVSLTQLLTLGVTGGIIPCPAALVVLLSAFSLHRVGLGLFLIVAFSGGLAAVLIAIGLMMVYARQFVARWKSEGPLLKRWLPLVSATFMLILGLGIAGQVLLTTGAGASFLAQGRLSTFLGIVFLGLFLGMRHSTDPDHVVAVSTIVSRERSMRQGALIGVLWGVGHTLTIFIVGSAIILFGLAIPPRVGLSMEFAVALMLILLGLLNLTGALRWLNDRFTPSKRAAIEVREDLPSPVSSTENSLNRWLRSHGLYQLLRPLVVGLVHGLAGSAAVALLVLATIRSPLWAIAYLLVFGIGTIIGMMLMTTAIAAPLVYSGRKFEKATSYLSTLSGLVSTAFGLFLVYQIGFVDGLFKATVHWTPQ